MVTIKDIAKMAGVSTGTVFRVIHNTGRFSETTAEKIRKIVKETGYSPNKLARIFSRDTVFKIGVLLPEAQMDGGYWQFPYDGLDYMKKELKDYKIFIEIFPFNRNSAESLKNSWSEFISAECHALLAAPVRQTEFVELLKELPDSFPLVLFDTPIESDRDNVSYIGQNKSRSGALCARLMKMLLAENKINDGKLLLTLQKHNRSRLNGFLDSFKDSPYELVVEELNEKDKKGSYSEIFKKHPLESFCGIYTTDESGHYVADEIEQHQLDRHIPLITFDLVGENTRHLEGGLIDVVITQRPEQQAYLGARLLANFLISGQHPNKEVLMPLNIVTKENLDEFFDFFQKEKQDSANPLFMPMH